MTELPPVSTNESVEPTEARFNMRALLIAMGVVALIAALVGPLVRRLDPEAQTRLLTYWGVVLTANVAWIGWQAKVRRDSEKLVGRTLVRLAMYDERVSQGASGRRTYGLVGAVFVAVMTIFCTSTMAIDPTPPTEAWHYFFLGLAAVWWLSMVVFMLWWRKDVRIGEHGALWDRRALLWDYLLEWRWSSDEPNILELKGIDQHNADFSLKVPVPTKHRPAVQAILDRNAIPRSKLARALSLREFSVLPLSQVARKFDISKVVGIIVVTAGAIVFAMSYVGGFTGIGEFDRSAFVGWIACGFSKSWRWRVVARCAGTPLVRLTGAINWREFAAFVIAAIVLFVLGTRLRLSGPLIAYATGFGVGWASLMALTNVAWQRIDLRANGVFLHSGVWPWAVVKVQKWAKPTNGKLVLSCGWRRVSVNVPPELREPVDTVLREKLGYTFQV
jgi:hypothetical protein